MRIEVLFALLGVFSGISALPTTPDAESAEPAAEPKALGPLMIDPDEALTRYPFLCDYLAAVPDCYCNCLLLACIKTFSHIVGTP
jgi:hypothetical protein